MLKIDLHVHTWYSDSSGSVEDVIKAAKRKGLDGLAITDHDIIEGSKEALRMGTDLLIIPGEEIKTDRGEILALGIRETIPRGLRISEAIRMIHRQNGLAILPHPTIPFFSWLKENDIKGLQIDGLEVISAITPLPSYFLKKNLKLARRLGLSIIAGSDSHSPETVGDTYTIINSKSLDLRDILDAIKLGQTRICFHPSKLTFKARMMRGAFLSILRAPFTRKESILLTRLSVGRGGRLK